MQNLSEPGTLDLVELENELRVDQVCEHVDHPHSKVHEDGDQLWYVFVHAHCLEPHVSIFCNRYVQFIWSKPKAGVYCPACERVRPARDVYTVLGVVEK